MFLRGAKLQSPTVYPIGHFFFAPHPGADRVEMRTKQLAVMPKTSWPKKKKALQNGKAHEFKDFKLASIQTENTYCTGTGHKFLKLRLELD